MSKYRKVITFDLSTNALEGIYTPYTGNDKTNAYYEVRTYMNNNGFKHEQGSVYVSELPMSKYGVLTFLEEMYKVLPWLPGCIKDINVDNRSKSHNYTASARAVWEETRDEVLSLILDNEIDVDDDIDL